MHLKENEAVQFRQDNISGLGSTHSSILKELITTNMRIIAKYSEEELSIPIENITQVRIKLEKGGFIGKAVATIFWFVLGASFVGSIAVLGLIFFALSTFFGFLAYRALEGTTYLYISSVGNPEIHFWLKGKSDQLVMCKDRIEHFM